MLSRFASSGLRGLLVGVMVMAPALILPSIAVDTAEIVALVAIFAAVLTMIEYSSSYPSIVEFRDAPPFNRVRFLSLFITVVVIATICRGQHNPNHLSVFIEAVGVLIGKVLDFPMSPLRMMDYLFLKNATPAQVALVKTSAALAFLISLLSLSFFVIMLSISRWPKGLTGFNVWVNLPTFDPAASADVVGRLNRDAILNIAIGIFLTYLIPISLWGVSVVIKPIDMTSYHSLVWAVAAWAFLPASVFMRGIAMRRVADMIAERRRRSEKANTSLVLA